MVHGESFFPKGTILRGLKKSIRLFAEGGLSRWVDAIVAVSDQARASLLSERSIDPRKVSVVRNGIEIAEPAPDALPAKRRELGLSGDEIVLVAVGRAAEVKNYPLLIESFARLKKATAKKVKLLIVGDGPEMPSLRELSARSGHAQDILLPGFRSDVRELLALSQVYILPSKSEGVSVALLEAMSMRLPAVATRVGGNVEVVSEGVTGLLVESGDAEGLSRALLRLVENEDERRKMGEAGRRKVSEQFEIGRSVRAFEELYSRRKRTR
jgi:glycosyltransferase involved in cell wall biosynthesis